MFDLITLIGAIALIFLVLMLRAMAALPFARLQGRFVPAAAPSGSEELFGQASTEFAALGFGAPRWILVQRVDGEANTFPLRAVLCAPDGGTVTLLPPSSPAHPHRLVVWYSHHLEDGRVAISQAFDPFFASTQTEEIVARAAGELSYADQWAAHRRWVDGLGSAPRAIDEAQLLDDAIGLPERQRQALLRRGLLREVNEHLAVPTLRYALRLLLRYFTRPKPPVDPRPVPAERLAMFARMTEQVRQRAPLRRTQWTLFGLSVVLFMALGALLWDPWIALGILLVVLIHELGHFLAMRAFGYRNVHLLALPLVGGVAMGVDAKPAATRRAWMSLMGPLPGIVIGWALLAVWVVGATQGWDTDQLFSLALLFLAINYLNVLPVPPLDGAHVVQSLLPPRWGNVQTLFIGIAAAIGAWFAWQFGFVLLALLAVLHLLGLPAAWQLRVIERELAADPAFAGEHRSSRLLRILRRIERSLGPSKQAQQRVNQALDVLTRLETQPMGVAARVGTGAVYAALLVVPLAVLVTSSFASLLPGPTTAAFEQQMADDARVLDDARAKAKAMTFADLLASTSEGQLLAAPEAAVIAASEARLGQALPPELREIYAIADGAPVLGLNRLQDLASARTVVDETLAPYLDTLSIEVDPAQAQWVEIPLEDARGWWHLGGSEDAPLFYLPEPDPRLPGKRVISLFLESPSSYASVREWLEEMTASAAQTRHWEREQTRRVEQIIAAWQDASVETMLAVYQPASLIEHVLLSEDLPDGVDAARLAATEARLGLTLPEDYATLLRTHDGFPRLNLLASGELSFWREHASRISDDYREFLFAPRDDDDASEEPSTGQALPALLEADLSDCVLAASTRLGADAHDWRPRLVWCPHAALPWQDLMRRRGYPAFRHWLMEQTAPVAAYRNG